MNFATRSGAGQRVDERAPPHAAQSAPPEERAHRWHWTVAAPFLRSDDGRWLTPFVPGARTFTLIPARPRPSWHERAGRAAGLGDWAPTWTQGRTAWNASRGGVITVFPQLALVVGLHRRCAPRRRPVVAWCFNLGRLYRGAKRRVARFACRDIERFVVHSRAERLRYAEWLDLPPERFRFVPLQRGEIPIVAEEERREPFVLAAGSAQRDYATLFEAVRRSRHPTLVVTAARTLAGLDVPANVEVRTALSLQECRRLAQRARVIVVPVVNDETASGQVTLVEAMRMGRAVVATRGLGSEDYIEPGTSGLLVGARSPEELARAIERVWDDAELRDRLGRNAARFAAEHCSDEAAGRALAEILDEVEARA